MQDEYIKAIEKIQMDKDRKDNMRKALEMEMASVKKPAKTTRLGTAAKLGIAAAAVALSMGTLMAIPSTRTAISASVRAFFNMVIPDGAKDGQVYESEARANRVVPTDDMSESEASEVKAIVSAQDKEQDDYNKTVTVKADYYKDENLNKYANYYADKQYNIMDLKKDADFDDGYKSLRTNDWFSEGFFVTYSIGENDAPKFGTIYVFKATEAQLDGFLKNNYNIVSYERKEHGQKAVAYDKFWSKTTDSEGNTVYSAEWKGPEPTTKILPSDCARFMNFKVTYDAANQIVVCSVEEGGGIG